MLEFAEGLDRIVVVEEKRDFLEQQVRAIPQRTGRPITVVGKLDEQGHVLFPVEGVIDADLVAQRLVEQFPSLVTAGQVSAGETRLQVIRGVIGRTYKAPSSRTPNFCSGCPHSSSTRLAAGQVAWGAPGCNCFTTVIEQPERHIGVMTQFGGEGAPDRTGSEDMRM